VIDLVGLFVVGGVCSSLFDHVGMSHADFVLDSLMDDATGVSFVAVEGGARFSSSLAAVGGDSYGGLQSGVQGTRTSKGKLYSVVSFSVPIICLFRCYGLGWWLVLHSEKLYGQLASRSENLVSR
jgi:hypothetical protein